MKISKKIIFFSIIIFCFINEVFAMSPGEIIDYGLGEVGDQIKEKAIDYLKTKTKEATIKRFVDNANLKKQCESSFLLASNVSLDNGLRLFLKKYGITFFPLQSFQRLKKAFAVCACDHPGETFTSISTVDPIPLIKACLTPLFKALMIEIGAWGSWLWYYTKMLGHKTIHTSKPVYDADLS